MVILGSFLVGLGAGILLNSLADNLPPDQLGFRHWPRRLRCPYCSAAYAPLYWLGLVSLLGHGGRCDHCAAPRSFRHVVVEVLAGLSLVYAWHWAAGHASGMVEIVSRFLALAIVMLIFILITVIDIEHRLILHGVTLPAAVLLGLVGALTPGHGLFKTLLGGLAGYGLMLGMFLFGHVFSRIMAGLRGRALDEVALGGGDVNLAGLVGLLVGWPGVILALLVTIVAGGLFSLGYILVQLLRRRYQAFAPVPYGPFLVLGALSVYFYGKEIALWLAGR